MKLKRYKVPEHNKEDGIELKKYKKRLNKRDKVYKVVNREYSYGEVLEKLKKLQ